MIAKDPYELKEILRSIERYLSNNITEISSIRIRNRCCNCFKKISDLELIFNEKDLIVKDWYFNCNFNEIRNHSMLINNFDYRNIRFQLEENKIEHSIMLKLNYYMSFIIPFNLTDYYPSGDFTIHGEQAYKDRQIKMIEREVSDGVVIMLQNFIDFYGLVPKFSQTIFIKFK